MERTKFTRKKQIVKATSYEENGKYFINIELDLSLINARKKDMADGQVGSTKIKIVTDNVLLKQKLLVEPKKIKNKKTANLSDKNSKPSINDRNKLFYPLAELLCEIVSTARKAKYTAGQLSQWAVEIRKLSDMHHIEYDRIEDILTWYGKNIGGQYIPIIYSGYALRMKFTNLEAAMIRSNQPQKGNKPNVVWDDNIKYVLGEDGQYHHHRTGSVYIP